MAPVYETMAPETLAQTAATLAYVLACEDWPPDVTAACVGWYADVMGAFWRAYVLPTAGGAQACPAAAPACDRVDYARGGL